MAIKQSTRFETTDGTLYTSEKDAQRAQEGLNNRDRKSFRLKTWEDFVNTQLEEGSEEIQKIYGNLKRGNYGLLDSKGIFERLWLGTINDTRLNQRLDYEKLLTTIIGNDETHIKADGVYDLVIDKGAKTIMSRGKEGTSLSAIVGGDNLTLAASPGGFTMTNSGVTIIGTAQFVENRWSVTHKEILYTVTWQAGE